MPIPVGDPSATRWETLDAWVDSGSTFTWIPRSVLERLGIGASEHMEFETEGGGVVARDVGEAPIRLMGATHTTPVVFGEEGASPLLGAFTLERFLLAADPVNQRLVPVRALAL
jgi:predicted aspartyl protease